MIQTGQRSTMNGGEKILGVEGGGTKTAWVLVERENCGRERPRFGFSRGARSRRWNCCKRRKRLVHYRSSGQADRKCRWLGTHSGRRRRRLFSQLAGTPLDSARIRSAPWRSPVYHQDFARVVAEQSGRAGALGPDRR